MIETELLKRKKIVSSFLRKDILLSSDFIEGENLEAQDIIEKIKDANILFLNKDAVRILRDEKTENVDWSEFERTKVLMEKFKDDSYEKFLQISEKEEKTKARVKVVFSYIEKPEKKEVADFVSIFNKRYNLLKNILLGRQELQGATSIKRILQKNQKEKVMIIGIVKDKYITKNNNIILTLEDPTGQITVVVSKTSGVYKTARDIVLDEVLGISGMNGESAIFANNIYMPDVPSNNPLKKSPDKGYAIFISDIHMGSTNFLEKEFKKFLKWINGNAGSDDHKEIAKNLKYIFLVGDLVDGIGIYPGQERELVIQDIYKQYEEVAKLLRQIPSDKKIIICPGNHDAVRIAEPQLPLYEDLAKPLWDMPNVIMVSNPSIINIHSSKNFQGLDVLLYHGYSFDFYVANVETIRKKKGYDNPEIIMKFLLQKRHLAPTHGSNLYVPDKTTDPLVIKKVPDIFVSGHIHKASMLNYRNITLICSSCWQSITSFQEKVGHHPEPARVPVLNLKTREMKILRF